jgi:hypothetical protein
VKAASSGTGDELSQSHFNRVRHDDDRQGLHAARTDDHARHGGDHRDIRHAGLSGTGEKRASDGRCDSVVPCRSIRGERTNGSSNDAATKLPLGFDQAPALGTAVYVLRMLGESEQNGGYPIEAHPVDNADACGIYSLDATGVRSNRSVEKLTPPKVAACWSGK